MNFETARRGRTDRIPPRVDRCQSDARGKRIVREVAEERRSGGHLTQARKQAPNEMPRICPWCATMRSAQRDEVPHTTGAVQLLDVVPSDQSAFRVPDDVDVFAAVIGHELFDAVGDASSQLVNWLCVEAEQPSQIDAVSAVSEPTEASLQRAEHTRGSEEPVHQEHRSLAAARGQRTDGRRRDSKIHDGSGTAREQPPCPFSRTPTLREVRLARACAPTSRRVRRTGGTCGSLAESAGARWRWYPFEHDGIEESCLTREYPKEGSDERAALAGVAAVLSRCAVQSANCWPNIGKPLLDSAFVASSCSTSQCSARTPFAMRHTSAAIQARGRPLPEKRPWTIT